MLLNHVCYYRIAQNSGRKNFGEFGEFANHSTIFYPTKNYKILDYQIKSYLVHTCMTTSNIDIYPDFVSPQLSDGFGLKWPDPFIGDYKRQLYMILARVVRDYHSYS